MSLLTGLALTTHDFTGLKPLKITFKEPTFLDIKATNSPDIDDEDRDLVLLSAVIVRIENTESGTIIDKVEIEDISTLYDGLSFTNFNMILTEALSLIKVKDLGK